MRRIRYRQRFLILAAAAIWSAVVWADSPTPPQAASEDTPSDADLAAWRCPANEEHYLPGDFYYCLGTQEYGAGHYERARQFYTTAASWASKPAQFILGIMAYNGDHESVNRPLALAWLELASERHREDFEKAYRSSYAAATPEEKQAADKLLQGMRPTYADATAAVRAERRYSDGMNELNRTGAGGAVKCVSGVGQSSGASASNNPSNVTVTCLPTFKLAQTIDKTAVNVFDGWVGHVSVGAMEQVSPVGSSPSSDKH